MHAVLEDKADEIVQYIDKTAAELKNHPHALWASLYYCCQSRFDYWLRHLPPVFTMPHASTIDNAIVRVLEQLTYDGCLSTDTRYTLARARLPARFGGCGIRARAHFVSDVAFLACFTECASVMIDHDGTPGFFPMLENTFGPGAFDVGGTRFQLFLSIRSATACEFMDAWARNRLSINGENATGPFDVDADQAGRDSTHRMQHRMTEQIERVRRDRLHREFAT